MSDSLVESAAPPEVQVEAEKMGWIPPSRFKGDPERFIDADAYVERGQTVLPIVKEQNKRLQAELAAVRAQAEATASALKAAQTAIDSIEERHSVETQKAVERARLQVKAQLVAASESGDHEGVAELTDQLTKLNAVEPEPAKKQPVAPQQFTPPADLAAWNAENPWFGTDKRRTALALGIAQELRESGDASTGRAFFDKVKVELDATLGVKDETPAASKVEGARNGGGEEPAARRGGKSFSSLPADAKAACDADSRKFVGPGKKYKTADEWRSRYAEMYFGS
jgi:hypothetical protein